MTADDFDLHHDARGECLAAPCPWCTRVVGGAQWAAIAACVLTIPVYASLVADTIAAREASARGYGTCGTGAAFMTMGLLGLLTIATLCAWFGRRRGPRWLTRGLAAGLGLLWVLALRV